MTHANAPMVLIIAAAITGCSNQLAAPESATAPPPLKSSVIDMQPKDPLAEQWLAEMTYLKRRMSTYAALSVLDAHGTRLKHGNEPGSFSGCCRHYYLVNDRYPDRHLELEFRWLPPTQDSYVPSDVHLLNNWVVINEVTNARTVDPAVSHDAL